jgi:hypothetical protein
MIPIACGLVLLQGAARRSGYRFPPLTPGRATALFTGLAVSDAVAGEVVGPQWIAQYYVALLALACGVFCWLVSRLTVPRDG